MLLRLSQRQGRRKRRRGTLRWNAFGGIDRICRAVAGHQPMQPVEVPAGCIGLTLVEAVGIEPTSGNPRRQASTSIADYLLLSLPGPPIGRISERPAPAFSSRTPERGLGPVTRM